MNLLLDPYPTEYKGYLIRSDFRIGIQIALCVDDVDLLEAEKISICLQLLYGAGIPPVKTAVEGLSWFISGGNENPEPGSGKKVMSYDYDSSRILSGFRKAFGIDLARTKIHWFEFLSLIGDLGDCALTGVIDIRTRDISDMKGKNRARMERLKEQYALPVVLSREEQDVVDAFFGKINKK